MPSDRIVVPCTWYKICTPLPQVVASLIRLELLPYHKSLSSPATILFSNTIQHTTSTTKMSAQSGPNVDPRRPETWPARQTYANETRLNHVNWTTEVKGVFGVESVVDFESIGKMLQATSFTIVVSYLSAYVQSMLTKILSQLPLDDLSCGLNMTQADVRQELERLNKKYPGLKLKTSSEITSPRFERHGFEENDDKNLGFMRRMMNGTMTEEHARADIAAEGNLDPYNIGDLGDEEGDDDEELVEHSEEDIAGYAEESGDSSDDEISASVMPVRSRGEVERS